MLTLELGPLLGTMQKNVHFSMCYSHLHKSKLNRLVSAIVHGAKPKASHLLLFAYTIQFAPINIHRIAGDGQLVNLPLLNDDSMGDHQEHRSHRKAHIQ